MAESLQGAIALVTGAAGGIGRAVCKELTAQGAIVIASDLAQTAEVEAAAYVQQDVTDEARWHAIAADIKARHGRLDCLVNNAGYSIVESIESTSIETWRKVQAINVESILFSLHAFTPLLRIGGAERKGGASVVNLSSVGGLRGAAYNAAYCAAKGAVTLFSKSAAVEYGSLRWPIRVNSVHPGGVDTDMTSGIMSRFAELGAQRDAEAARKSLLAAIPARRLAGPEEIAAGIAFLCSTASSFMTGSEFVIDGGYTAR